MSYRPGTSRCFFHPIVLCESGYACRVFNGMFMFVLLLNGLCLFVYLDISRWVIQDEISVHCQGACNTHISSLFLYTMTAESACSVRAGYIFRRMTSFADSLIN